jgi:drug/metabolite transporter (DMT)-like permease
MGWLWRPSPSSTFFTDTMVAALLTTLFWSFSTLFAQRSIKAVGTTRANIGRLVFAFVVLGLISHGWGGGLGGAGRNWLLLSGVIGMGLGDLAYFVALPQLGSRLTLLITQCLAAPIAALIDWLWLGTRISAGELLWGAVILGGVALAITPGSSNPPRVKVRPMGFVFALMAAFGQGYGAVLSRKASLMATQAGETIDGFTGGYQRIVGGLVITVAWFAIKALIERRMPGGDTPPECTWRSHGWIAANASCGAVIGVSCYQWALFTTPSAIVLPIVACTPLVVIPFAYWFEGEKPSRRSLAGGLVAVAGAAALSLAK